MGTGKARITKRDYNEVVRFIISTNLTLISKVSDDSDVDLFLLSVVSTTQGLSMRMIISLLACIEIIYGVAN